MSTRRQLILSAASLAALSTAGCSQGEASKSGLPATDDMSLGNADAPVKVVEYASLTCHHCATFHEQVFPQFKAAYIDTGKVHYTFKEFLTPPTNIAAAGFLLARCAGRDRYFAVVDAVFRSQAEWGATPPLHSLVRVAQSMGMNEEDFQACVTDREALDALMARVEASQTNDGVRATPTFFVNGKMVKEGAMTLEELDAAIAAASSA